MIGGSEIGFAVRNVLEAAEASHLGRREQTSHVGYGISSRYRGTWQVVLNSTRDPSRGY